MPELVSNFAVSPRFAAASIEDVLSGGRKLRRVFNEKPLRYAGRDAPLVRIGRTEPTVLLLRSGFAYRSCLIADGRRAILDVLVPGDFAGLDHIFLARPGEEITAANRVGYSEMPTGEFRQLLADPQIGLHVMALMAETRWRGDRIAASLGRLDAMTRICVLLLDIHDRLRRRNLINRPTFNLPLTQEQIADHLGLTLVHVNRTLRRLREQKLVIVDRQVVIIMELEQLRSLAQGLPKPADLPDADAPIQRLAAAVPPPGEVTAD